MQQPKFVSLIALWIVVGGCSGDPGAAGQPGAAAPDTVVGSEPFGANDQCSNGGVTVSIGSDTNGNGALDDSEVKQSFNLCSGDRGSSAISGISSHAGKNDLRNP